MNYIAGNVEMIRRDDDKVQRKGLEIQYNESKNKCHNEEKEKLNQDTRITVYTPKQTDFKENVPATGCLRNEFETKSKKKKSQHHSLI